MAGEIPQPTEPSAPDAAPVDLTRRHTRLFRRTALVSVLTLVSRVLGYLREMLSAALFGDRSAVFDAFITAWRVPNLFRRFLGEGALSTSFQTALTEVEGAQGEAAGERLFAGTARLVFGVLVGLCLAVMALVSLMPDTMPVTGWHWLGADPEPVRDLTVRVMPFVVLICLSALIGGALHVRGIFGAPAWAPAVLNIAWLVTLGIISWRFGFRDTVDDARHLEMARVLAWGVLAAGLAQLLVQIPALRRAGFLRRPRNPGREPGLDAGLDPGRGAAETRLGARDVLRRSLPLAFGAAVYQINVMLDGLMAEGLLPDGGPTLHYYANRVQQFPMALIAVAATSAVFPLLQAHGQKGARVSLRQLHDRTHRAIAFVALPASVGLFVLARAVIATSFERGAFGPEGVERASAALRYLTLAILPAGATGLVARTYYAMGDFRTPVRVSSVMLVLNVGLNLVLIRGFGMDVDGLALATALTSWAGLLALWPGLCSRLDLPPGDRAHLGPLARMALAAALSGGAAAGCQRALGGSSGSLQGGAGLLVSILAGVLAYAVATRALGLPEARRRRAGPPP